MYRVIFHPQMVSVCEKVNYSLGTAFKEDLGVAIYANLAKPVGVGDCFNVRVFVESQTIGSSGQTRVLYLFSAKVTSGGVGTAIAHVASAL